MLVLLLLCELLVTNDMQPPGGTLDHQLWTCLFMKVYGNQQTMAGGDISLMGMTIHMCSCFIGATSGKLIGYHCDSL